MSMPPIPRGFRDLVRLETRALTLAFWGSVALFVLALWLCRFPPMIDYPQHLAIGAILRRLVDPASLERQLYDINLITYNGGFHLLVAALSFVVSPEVAGKIILSSYPPMLGIAGLALCRVAHRPRWYALLLLPMTFSYAAGWGFVNYTISVPLALLAFTWWLRYRQGEPKMLVRLWLASLALAYTHVFATLCLCAAIGIAGLVRFGESGRSFGGRMLALARLPWAVFPAIVWCGLVFVRNRVSPHANWDAGDDGLDVPLWHKLLHLTAYAVGNFSDHSDQVLLGFAIAIVILIGQSPWRTTRSEPLMKWLALGFFGLYCLIPRVLLGTWFMFERMPIWVMAFAIPAAPLLLEKADHRLRPWAAVIALAAGLNTVVHLARIPDEADASAILDDIPEGRNVVALTYSNTADPALLRETWVHTLAYYVARRPGTIGYSFTRFESMPVHYRLDARPPLLPGGIEWYAQHYDPESDYGRHYDLVLVRTPDEAAENDPRELVFGRLADGAKVLSRRGRFWLLELGAK